LVPFLIFAGFAAKFMTPSRAFAPYPGEEGPDYGLLISTMVWQFSGFDSVAAFSNEANNPCLERGEVNYVAFTTRFVYSTVSWNCSRLGIATFR
jgi:hypothetical protein